MTRRFSNRTTAGWLALILLVAVGAACGGTDLAERATSIQNATQPGVLTAGDTYISIDAEGNRTTKEWVEGAIVDFEGKYQIVQAEGYVGGPVFVDDEYKATLPSCSTPAGSTWTSSDGTSGVREEGELAVYVGEDPCVYRARPTPEPAQVESAQVEPTAEQAQPAATPAPDPATAPSTEPTAEPQVETTLVDQLETQQHMTDVSDVIFALPTPIDAEEEEFSALGYSNFHYEYDDGAKRVRVTIANIGGFFSDAEEQEFKDNIAARSKTGAENEADLLDAFGTVRGLERTGDGRAVTIETEAGNHPGYEADVVAGDRTGHLLYARRDGVKFVMLGLGISDQEWTELLQAVRFESAEPIEEEQRDPDRELTREELREEAQRILELVEDRRFAQSPYDERELAPMTGGWSYVNAPPFGAIEPGEDGELDAHWIACREGDGFACDTLSVDAEVNSSYQRFGLTCGGRSAVDDCAKLLGSDPHPAFLTPYDDNDDPFRNRVGGYRLDRIPGPESAPPGSEPARDLLWAECGLGNSASACWKLGKDFVSTPDLYEAYGLSCGGRRSFASMDCFSMMRADVDKIPAGSPAPGTYDAEADELWERCDAVPTDCFRFIVFSLGVDSDRRAEFSPYNTFGNSCGGEYDRPLTELTLRGGCEEPFAEMPTIDDVTELAAPPG